MRIKSKNRDFKSYLYIKGNEFCDHLETYTGKSFNISEINILLKDHYQIIVICTSV